MEASALHAPKLARRSIPGPLLRLRSDEQLVALFRAGSEEAFSLLHDRYRQRLFGYVRQMLSAATRADAEDVLQDVFVRAYGALRADDREVNVRAWLYRVAHNRCVDQLRRPVPAPSDVFETSRTPPLQDPIEAAQRREDLRRLVADVGRLPDQQRSALLMREIDGLAYADIAAALEVTVPAVKSLLVRARTGLVEAIQARDTDCAEIRSDLLDSYDRGVKASARARRHLRECGGCRDYRTALKGMRRSFAALSPAVGFAPLAVAAKALGIGGAGAGGAGAAGAGVSGVAACKVAAVVCAGALATGGAMEARHLTASEPADAGKTATAQTSERRATTTVPATQSPAVITRRAAAVTPAAAAPALTVAERRAAKRRTAERAAERKLAADGVSIPASDSAPAAPVIVAPVTKDPVTLASGGTEAPADAPPVVKETTGSTQQPTTTVPAATAVPEQPTTGTTPAGTGTTPAATATPAPAGPAPEH